MKVKVVANADELNQVGADILADTINAKPDANIVLATGNSPMGIYAVTAQRIADGQVDVSQIRVFQLDGYLGVHRNDARSLEGWLRRSVVEPWHIEESNFVRLPEDTIDPQGVCKSFNESVQRAGGFDLAILGLGPNGHLGFNEPPSTASSTTRVVHLTEESLDSNARYWGSRDLVPRQAVTAGMDILLQARHVVLVVSGEHKQDILRRTLSGPMTPDVPSSFLQQGKQVTVLADSAAYGNHSLSAGS